MTGGRALVGGTHRESFGSPWMNVASRAGVIEDPWHIRGIGPHALNVAERAGVMSFAGITRQPIEEEKAPNEVIVELPPLPETDTVEAGSEDTIASITEYLSKQALAVTVAK